MKSPKYHLFCCCIILFVLFSCSERIEAPVLYDPSQLQDGQTGFITNIDLSGRGQILNRANTTVVFSGNVIVDDLTVIGKVIVSKNATLTVRGLVTVAGGASLQLNGNLSCQNLTLVGNLFINETMLMVSGQFTAAGGTNTYFQNGFLKVNDFRILGNIYALQNDYTEKTNGYSMVEMIGNQYLNRAGGSILCGPLMFNTKNDSGSSGVDMTKISPDAAFPKTKNTNPYLQNNATEYYKFNDNCTPLTNATPFL